MMTLIRTLLFLCLMVAPIMAALPGDLYKSGDVVEFRVENKGKVIGTQKATCVGVREVEDESLLFFNLETHSVVERGGRSYDFDISSEAGYRLNGLPRSYSYDLKLLNASVSQEGRFSERDYSGVTTKLGVDQPFSYPTQTWAQLFDNNFALQWELAMSAIGGNPGDSLTIQAVIPQLSKALVVSILVRPFESVEYDGKTFRTRVLELKPLSQTLYIDESGRLLKALDKATGIAVFRQVAGQAVEIARESILTLIGNRFAGYLFLLVVAIIWYFGLTLKGITLPLGWMAFAVTTGLYWLSIEALLPIQNSYFAWMIDPRGGGNAYFTLFGSALIFGIVEMAAIAIPPLALFLLKKLDGVRLAVVIGVAAGIGYGLMQAANLTQFNTDGSIVMKVDLLQKTALIGVCAACGGLVALFMIKRSPAHYYLIPIGIKTLLNWTSVFLQKGALRVESHAFISLLFAAVAVGILLLLRKNALSHERPRKQIKTN